VIVGFANVDLGDRREIEVLAAALGKEVPARSRRPGAACQDDRPLRLMVELRQQCIPAQLNQPLARRGGQTGLWKLG
jgi:hypothetical protein